MMGSCQITHVGMALRRDYSGARTAVMAHLLVSKTASLLTKHRDLELHHIEVSLTSVKSSIFINACISSRMENSSKRHHF